MCQKAALTGLAQELQLSAGDMYPSHSESWGRPKEKSKATITEPLVLVYLSNYTFFSVQHLQNFFCHPPFHFSPEIKILGDGLVAQRTNPSHSYNIASTVKALVQVPNSLL